MMTNLNSPLQEGCRPCIWVAQKDEIVEPRRHPFQMTAIAAIVVAAHIGLFALLVNQTTKREVTLASITPAASVRVTMVKPPEPPPEPIVPAPPVVTPPVLTSENSERVVAEPPKVAPKPKPKVEPKPKVKPKPTPKTEPAVKPVEPVPDAVPAPTPQAVAQTSPNEKLMDLPSSGPKDVQKVGCRVPAPEYPRAARRQKLEGDVVLRLVIDAKGQVDSVTVARSSGNESLDDAARKAVLGAACTPYLENGRAIAVRVAQPVSFRINR